MISEAASLTASRGSARDRVTEYTKPVETAAEDIRTYFEGIQKRMTDKRLNYEAAAQKAETMGDRNDILKSARGIVSGISVPAPPNKQDKDPDAINRKRTVMQENYNLLAEKKTDYLEAAKANYGKSFRDAAVEMEKILKDGSIAFRRNQNYGDMRSAIKTIKEVFGNDQKDINDLKPEQKETLMAELKKLETASEKYLALKYQDEKGYSPKALQRIEAAKLASAFVRGRMADLKMDHIQAQNKELMKNLPKSIVYKTNGQKAFEAARDQYNKNRTVENLAEMMAYEEVIKQTGELDKKLINGNIEKKTRVYQALYENNQIFKTAVKNGELREVTTLLKVEGSKVKQNQAPQPEKVPEKAATAAKITAPQMNIPQ